MTARIPPVVAALAAALDAHEFRLYRRAPSLDGAAQRAVIASLRAVTVTRENLLREAALAPDTVIGSLDLLATWATARTERDPMSASGMVDHRAAAYLRWCVRRLRVAALPRATFALSPPPNEGETLGEYRARAGTRSGSETHAARTVAWHNGHWETIRERGT